MSAAISARQVLSERRRFLAFLGVGVINTCFGYAAFAFFLWIGFDNDLAVLFGMVAGILFNYGTIGAVFASRGLARLPHFLAVYGSLLVANIFALKALTSAGMNPFFGEAIIIAFITPISFLAMRRFVFPPAPELHP
jgi:putative flippase GtrA